MLSKNKKINTKGLKDLGFIFIAFIYQIIFVFQGLDFADEGFSAVFYQQIFHDPQCVAFNFMYWFTGILGGVYYYLFPQLGLFGIRLLGVIITTTTLSIVYYSLKNYISLLNLRTGLFTLLLFINNDNKEMHYDNLWLLLFVIASILIFKGLIQDKYYKTILSGSMISLGMFARTPSVIGLTLIISIFYYGYLTKKEIVNQIKHAIFFTLGFSLTTLFILIIMKTIGHLNIYLENLKLVFGMGFDKEGPNNVSRLLKLFISSYLNSIYNVVFIFIFIFTLFAIIDNSRFKNIIKSKTASISIETILALIFLYFLFDKKVTYNTIILLITGFSLIIGVIMLLMESAIEQKLMVFLGLLILLFAPFGSEGGMFSVGRYSLWIIFPFVLDFSIHISKIHMKLILYQYIQKGKNIHLKIGNDNLTELKKYLFILLVIACVYFSYFYPYFDLSDRRFMHYPIKNALAKGIYTTKERSIVVNELLEESKKYINKNDVVFAYDCIPMFYFLTQTKPYMNNPWPGAYYPKAFMCEFEKTRKNSKELPIVILQKIKTIASDWPQNSNTPVLKTPSDCFRDSIMNHFLQINKYHKAWENRAFEILIPDNKNPKNTENRN